MRHGAAVSRSALRLVTVRAQGEEATVPQCALAVRRNASGALELLVYGQGQEPVLTVPLRPLAASQSMPIDMTAERDYDSGRVSLKIPGWYQATIPVTELGYWAAIEAGRMPGPEVYRGSPLFEMIRQRLRSAPGMAGENGLTP